MGLKIQQIIYRNFRNYSEYELRDLGDITLFIGPNAIGKTNLIEGIQLLTAFTSFRSSRSDHFIKFGEDHAPVLSSARQVSCVSALQEDDR